jgi:hypothetical protein
VLGCVTLAAATTVPASLATGGQASASRNAATELTRCSPDQRKAVFTGRMTHVPGSVRMVLRFKLFQRDADGDWVALRNRRLERRHRSLPGVRTFVYRQTLRGLPSGYAYRVLVRFRWYSDSGEVVLRERHRSRSCRVPSL